MGNIQTIAKGIIAGFSVVLLLMSTVTKAEGLAIRNQVGGMIVITESRCPVTQVQALYIESKIPVQYAYATDKDDNVLTRGCWVIDEDESQIHIVWEDWSAITVAFQEWVVPETLAVK